METIRGKTSLEMTASDLQKQLMGYKHILLDLGTGDGLYVRCRAEQHKERFFIGVDACRENLRHNSRRKLPNALFIIANAQALPTELNGLASQVTINFPWGSLLESLLSNEDSLVSRLPTIARPFAAMDICLNAEALVTAGCSLESGADQIERIMNADGWKTKSRSWMDAHLLRSFPTTWAKRLAFGRDPRAIRLSVQRQSDSLAP
jgi:16S rRNA (adenine(1408)-N(1))-methyltransferase